MSARWELSRPWVTAVVLAVIPTQSTLGKRRRRSAPERTRDGGGHGAFPRCSPASSTYALWTLCKAGSVMISEDYLRSRGLTEQIDLADEAPLHRCLNPPRALRPERSSTVRTRACTSDTSRVSLSRRF